MFEIVERQEMAQGTVISNWIKAPKIKAKSRGSSSSCGPMRRGSASP
jgi:hypothetical protein